MRGRPEEMTKSIDHYSVIKDSTLLLVHCDYLYTLLKYMNDQQKVYVVIGNGRREVNGCTVHFNNILLQLSILTTKISIKSPDSKLKSARKHFFFL